MGFSGIKHYICIFGRKLKAKIGYYFCGESSKKVDILFISPAHLPTLQLSFLNPLNKQVGSTKFSHALITEQQIKDIFGFSNNSAAVENYLLKKLQGFSPEAIIFCRYGGLHADFFIEYAKRNGIATIYHIDDDLLNVPIELGSKKYHYHNNPQRLKSIQRLLPSVNLVYCSNWQLVQCFKDLGVSNNFYAGKIYAAGNIIRSARLRKSWKIGYMGFDHNDDFALVMPAIICILDDYPLVTFELFGSIALPDSMKRFGSRVKVIEPVESYDNFMSRLASLEWDIGICPLQHTPFNRVKSDTKWVEYTAVGTAVIATKGIVYDDCCADNCGLLVEKDDWYRAISELLDSDEKRFDLAQKAQLKVREKYTERKLLEQIDEVVTLSKELMKA